MEGNSFFLKILDILLVLLSGCTSFLFLIYSLKYHHLSRQFLDLN